MTIEATRQAYLAASTGVTEGPVRFNLLNGLVLQRLLFEKGLHRKPVSLLWYRLLWPLLRQRNRLLPLVMPEGIYCFYSRPLVANLAGLIGSRRCVEIAAGDGTLTRFLTDRGVPVRATDDHSWATSASSSEGVETLDAVKALRVHQPEVVVCSWPPPGNAFERHVFTTPSVQTYIVVTSRSESAAGNWDDDRAQQSFDCTEDHRPSRMVLPQGDGAVAVFQRRR
jgi:hypothetical protein